MSDKKPTIPALLRKIERLEAQVRTLHIERQRAVANYGDILREVVEYKTRFSPLSATLSRHRWGGIGAAFSHFFSTRRNHAKASI